MDFMRTFKGLLRLIRFELPVSAGVCVVMGQIFALRGFGSIFSISMGFSSVFLISASILVLNDYFDIETDKINAPERPIPSSLVSPIEALSFGVVLALLGLLLSYFINITSLLISAVLTIIGFLYNRFFKRSGLPGNLMVSFSVGMTFIYGGATVGLPFNKIVLFFGLIAALIDLGEEIAADAMDAKGDILIHSNSIAIIYGGSAAVKLSGIIFFIIILLSFLPFLLNWFTGIYLIPIGIMDLSIAFGAIRLLKSHEKEGRKYIRLIYLGATSGLLVFLIMKLFNI